MNNNVFPLLPFGDGPSMLEIDSIVTPTDIEKSVTVDGSGYPHYSQTWAAPLFPQNNIWSPAARYASQKIPSKDEWESHRAEITRLYREEKKTLKEVMTFMRERYHFRATTKMYKTRISDWDIRRNLRWSERENACRVVKQRLLTGEKVSKVVIRGQERDISLLRRHMRHPKSRALSQILKAEVQTINRTSGNSFRTSRYFSNVNLQAPLKESIQRNLHPADNHRDIEIICLNTSYVCGATVDLKSVRGCSRLFNYFIVAGQWLSMKQYKQVRLSIGRALDAFRADLCVRPLVTLLGLLQVCILRDRWGTERHFFTEFARNAYDLSSVLCGDNHPITKVLSHISRVPNGLSAIAAAVQAAIASLTGRNKPMETFRLVSWLRRRLIEVWTESESFNRARELLESEVEDCKRFRVSKRYRMRAVLYLARYYLQHEWSCPTKFYHTLETAFQEEGEQSWDRSTRSRVCRLLAHSAIILGNEEAAETLFKEARALTMNQRGRGSTFHIVSTRGLIDLLLKQGRDEEAEHVRDMCRLTDDMENLMQV